MKSIDSVQPKNIFAGALLRQSAASKPDGVTQPAGINMPMAIQADQLVSAKLVAEAYYREMLVRYQKKQGNKLTRWGRMMLESLICLYPSVSDTLENPFFEDDEIGVLTGRSILSLIKEGAKRRPNSVLTKHYMAELLGLTDEDPKISLLKQPEDGLESDTELASSLVDRADSPRLQLALDSVLDELEKTGLIWQENINQTALLHPYSEKQHGEESLFDWLMQRRKTRLAQDNSALRETHADAMAQFEAKRYLMDVIYFQDQTFKGINGWDVLALILKAQQIKC